MASRFSVGLAFGAIILCTGLIYKYKFNKLLKWILNIKLRTFID